MLKKNFGNMKNTVIFTASKCSIARATARNLKAGFFCVSEKGVFSTYKAAARLQYRTGKTGKLPRKQCVSTAVFGGPLFCLPVNVETHHAHRNHNTTGTSRRKIAANYQASQRTTRGEDGARIAPAAHRIPAKIEAGYHSLSP